MPFQENREYFQELTELAASLGLSGYVGFVRSCTEDQKWAMVRNCTAVVYTPPGEGCCKLRVLVRPHQRPRDPVHRRVSLRPRRRALWNRAVGGHGGGQAGGGVQQRRASGDGARGPARHGRALRPDARLLLCGHGCRPGSGRGAAHGCQRMAACEGQVLSGQGESECASEILAWAQWVPCAARVPPQRSSRVHRLQFGERLLRHICDILT